MENTKKEKAIAQALASLQIDRIYVNPNFVASYRQKHNLSSTNNGMKLVFKRGGNNGRKK